MGNEFEQRSYIFDVRAEETERGKIISGRPIVYNSRTDIGPFDEIIESGALDNADLSDVRFLVNHDISMIPLARSRRNNVNSTMQLIVDAEGMGIKVYLDTENNSNARALYSAVERGDISGMSFLFSVSEGGDTWTDIESDHPTRHIKSISFVAEVSAVTFPAYSATTINARSNETLDSARSALDNARQQLPKPQDNNLKLLKEKTKLLGGLKK